MDSDRFNSVLISGSASTVRSPHHENRFETTSVQKGLALIGAGIAVAMGHPELLTASVTPEGIQVSGLIGVAAPMLLGLWKAIRDEFND